MDIPFLSGLSNIDILLLIGAGIVFLIMAYMIFKQVMKAIIIGVVFAAVPVVLYLLGMEIDLSLQTIIWFSLFGIATYFVYDVISGWFKIMRILTWPIRAALRKPAVKAKQKEEKKGKEDKPKDFSPKDGKKEEDSGKKQEKKAKESKDEDYEEVK